MNRRTVLALASGAPLLSGCFYDRYFDIEWDEEVKLHDGRVIVVHTKRKYERQRKSLLPYDPVSIQFRGNEIEFNINPAQRLAVKTRQPLGCLDQFDSDWFLVVSGQGPYGVVEESPTRWGSDFTTNEQRLAKFLDGEFRPVSWEQAPPNLRYLNIISNLFYPEFAEWNGKKVTLAMKDKFRATHGIPAVAQITRPIRMNTAQGKKQ